MSNYFDFSTLSNEELYTLINLAQEELRQRPEIQDHIPLHQTLEELLNPSIADSSLTVSSSPETWRPAAVPLTYKQICELRGNLDKNLCTEDPLKQKAIEAVYNSLDHTYWGTETANNLISRVHARFLAKGPL